MPTDKGELIQYLSERIKQAEVCILLGLVSFEWRWGCALKRNQRKIEDSKVNIIKELTAVEIVWSWPEGSALEDKIKAYRNTDPDHKPKTLSLRITEAIEVPKLRI